MRTSSWGRLALILLLTLAASPRAAFARAELQLDLHLVIFERSGWTRALVTEHLERAGKILSPCGIALGKVSLSQVAVSDRDLKVEHYFGQDLNLLNSPAFEGIPRPAVFLVQELVDESGWEVDPSFSWQAAPGVDPVRQNTAWISNTVNSADFRRYLRDSSYNPLAHELGHLLGVQTDVTHLKKNLMGDGRDTIRDGSVTPAQCKVFRESPLLKPLAQ